MKVARAALLVLMLLLQACGGGSEGEATPATPAPPVPPPAAANFTLLPARVGLLVAGQGAMRTLRASAAVSWSSSNPAVAEVDSTGLVTARTAGRALISATVGAQTRTAAVAVHASNATTTADLIGQALVQNRISAEQALIYRVYASFGDSRLPAEFEGAPQAAP
jgi:Bacterial Ig-like domain (group 2)